MNNNKLSHLINLESIEFLFSIFNNRNSEIRLVGGSIRDAIIDKEIKDIDLATTLEPNEVLVLLKENNIEYVSVYSKFLEGNIYENIGKFYFYNDIHFNRQGNKIIANQLIKKIN